LAYIRGARSWRPLSYGGKSNAANRLWHWESVHSLEEMLSLSRLIDDPRTLIDVAVHKDTDDRIVSHRRISAYNSVFDLGGSWEKDVGPRRTATPYALALAVLE